jgi:hemoglobin
MGPHIALHRTHPIEPKHFDRWLAHWNASIDARFAGPKAEEAKARAASIAPVMAWKVRGG